MNVLLPILDELRRMVEELEGSSGSKSPSHADVSPAERDVEGDTGAPHGEEVVLEETVDPAVLGGLVVRVGSTVYDGSVRTQIRQIRENLQKG